MKTSDPLYLVHQYRRRAEGACAFFAALHAETPEQVQATASRYTGSKAFHSARQRQRTYWNNRQCEAAIMVRELPDALREIAEGRRVGKPTLTRSDPQHQLAAYLSGKPVEWRD
jgi:hypothetical protein